MKSCNLLLSERGLAIIWKVNILVFSQVRTISHLLQWIGVFFSPKIQPFCIFLYFRWNLAMNISECFIKIFLDCFLKYSDLCFIIIVILVWLVHQWWQFPSLHFRLINYILLWFFKRPRSHFLIKIWFKETCNPKLSCFSNFMRDHCLKL